jgi:hypothetical protein
MGNKKKDKKAKEASDRAVIASVTEEMAQPRMAGSAQIRTDKQINARGGKPR